MRTVIGFVVVAGGLSFLGVKAATNLAATPPVAGVAASAEVAAPVSRARPPGGRKVTIPADDGGHYFSNAVINGHTIAVVVDTGATSVALTAESARRLGLKLKVGDYNVPISTANGTVFAAQVVLSEVRVGSIAIPDVVATVVPGAGLSVNLLGMSFLSRLRKFEVGGGQLVLMD